MFVFSSLPIVRESRFIAEALRREGVDAQLAHNADRVNHLRQALSFVGYVARHTTYPGLCHLLTISYLVNPMTGMRWRVYDMDGFPPAAKVSALMQVWCDRLPRWSPDQAHAALLRVRPFGRDTGLVALAVYQWLGRTWNDPTLPPQVDGS